MTVGRNLRERLPLADSLALAALSGWIVEMIFTRTIGDLGGQGIAKL